MNTRTMAQAPRETAVTVKYSETELKLQCLSEFLKSYDNILSVNLVGFITENVWKHVPFLIQSALLGLSYDDLCTLPASRTLTCQDDNLQQSDESKSTSCRNETSNLRQFIQDVHNNRLENMQVLTALEGVCGVYSKCDKEPSDKDPKRSQKLNTFMSEKKSHEVDIMASVIAAVAKDANIQQIVDVGSGKGYLGQHLAFKYALNVLGIDSSQSNSHGAKVRGQKMRKQQLGKKHKAQDEVGERSTDEKNCDASCKNAESYNETSQLGAVRSEFSDTKEHEHCQSTETFSKMSVSSKTEHGLTDDLNLQSVVLDVGDTSESKDISINRTCSVVKLVENEKSRNPNDIRSGGPDETSLYKPVTAFVDTQTNIAELLCNQSTTEKKVLLSGLHTCGDLSSTMLRLFSTNPSIRILCNVPCCYHLLSEQFDQQDDDLAACGSRSSEKEQCGFPMSSCLRSQNARIGDVARMAACMAAERLAYEKKLSTEKLFYRAVLQVILKENYSIPTRQQRTGKLASKCNSFTDYTRRALKKMGFEENKLSDEAIQQYYDSYKSEMKKLEAFHQLRATLAPSIEALILLDKLCYLQEQESVEQAFLVRLFNPVTSPRCHAIIATKH